MIDNPAGSFSYIMFCKETREIGDGIKLNAYLTTAFSFSHPKLTENEGTYFTYNMQNFNSSKAKIDS